MPTILIALSDAALPDGILEEIRALAPDYRLLVSRNLGEIEAALNEIEIVAGGFEITGGSLRELINRTPRLKWFQQWGAGADWLRRFPEVRAKDFILTNASGVHPIQISEHIFALLLAFARQLPKAVLAQQQRQWLNLGNQDVFELEGKTMLLIGVGAIGERTAMLAQAFGMHVIGLRRSQGKAVAGINEMADPAALHQLLPRANVVVLTVPLTDETYHLIGERELALMPEDAVLINIGRGGTIDEAALDVVLRAGKLAGVGLDVFEEEPLPETSPLWQHEHVIVTSHNAGLSPHYHQRAFRIFLENLRRYLAGRELINVVDKDRGY